MEEILELYKQILGPATIGLAIICLINWIKMFPGAQNEKLNWLWPMLAGIFGSGLMLLYVWTLSLVVLDIKQIIIVLIVGLFLGFGSSGLYTLAKKINK